MYKRQELVPTATHATLVLRDDIDAEADRDEAGYVPVLTLSLIHISEPTRPY